MNYKQKINYKQKWALEFAEFVKSFGFQVYMAESQTYGFVTDDTESRVLSFQFDGLTATLSGNYSGSRNAGSGWQMHVSPHNLTSAEKIKSALYAYPPSFCGKDWGTFTTVKQHLDRYQSSSRYTKL